MARQREHHSARVLVVHLTADKWWVLILLEFLESCP